MVGLRRGDVRYAPCVGTTREREDHMPFTVIQGSFHLVGRTAAGKDTGFEPDGDSMQFKPDDPNLLDRLQRNGSAYRLTSSARRSCASRA
jgi:hypothetical protein